MAKIYKTSVNLPDDAVKALEELANQRGTSMAEVIRQAISTEKFVSDEARRGNRILVQNPKDNSYRQVVTLYGKSGA